MEKSLVTTYVNIFKKKTLPSLLVTPQKNRKKADAQNGSFFTLYGGQLTISTQLLTPNYLLYSPTNAAPQFL